MFLNVFSALSALECVCVMILPHICDVLVCGESEVFPVYIHGGDKLGTYYYDDVYRILMYAHMLAKYGAERLPGHMLGGIVVDNTR